MANTPTLSLRVPPGQHQVVRDVVARLKADPGFADILRTLLTPAGEAAAVQANAPDPLNLGRRLDAVERWIADHEASTVQAAPVQAGVSTADTSPAGASTADTASTSPAEPWTTGEGRMKRLTSAGVAELDRRLAAGESVADIAEALGISVSTVRKRREGRTADD